MHIIIIHHVSRFASPTRLITMDVSLHKFCHDVFAPRRTSTLVLFSFRFYPLTGTRGRSLDTHVRTMYTRTFVYRVVLSMRASLDFHRKPLGFSIFENVEMFVARVFWIVESVRFFVFLISYLKF